MGSKENLKSGLIWDKFKDHSNFEILKIKHRKEPFVDSELMDYLTQKVAKERIETFNKDLFDFFATGARVRLTKYGTRQSEPRVV